MYIVYIIVLVNLTFFKEVIVQKRIQASNKRFCKNER